MMAIDPVCKMNVDEKTAKFDNTSTRARRTTSVHRGARRRLRRTRKSTYENSSLKTKNPFIVTDGLNDTGKLEEDLIPEKGKRHEHNRGCV